MLTGHCHALASRRAKVKKEEEGEGEGGERRRRRAPLSFRPPSSTFFPPPPPRPQPPRPRPPPKKKKKNSPPSPTSTARARGRAQLGRRNRQPGVLRRQVGRRRQVPGPEVAGRRARRLWRGADARVGPGQEVDDPVRAQGLPVRFAQEGAERKQRRGPEGLIDTEWSGGSVPFLFLFTFPPLFGFF